MYKKRLKKVGLSLVLSSVVWNQIASAAPGATIVDVGRDGDSILGPIANQDGTTTYKYGDNITITSVGSNVGDGTGLYSNFGGDIIVGDNLTIITTGRGGDGFRTNPSGTDDWMNSIGVFTVGDGLKVKVTGESSDTLNMNGKSKAIIGKNAELISEGLKGYGLRANFSSTIEIGDNYKVTTKGADSHAVFLSLGNASAANPSPGGGKVITGDNGTLTTTNSNSNGVHVSSINGLVSLGNNTTVNVSGVNSKGLSIEGDPAAGGVERRTGDQIVTGSNLKVISSGAGGHGVHMYGINGKITLGEMAEIYTTGTGAHALYGHGLQIGSNIYGNNGKIVVGDKAILETTGDGSHGVYTDWATSSIEFQAGATINVSGNSSYALFADAGKITSKLDMNGDVVSGGKFLINGDMTTINGGIIDLVLGNGSIFVGSADEATGNIKLKMEAGSKWYVTADKYVDLTMEAGSALYLGTPQDQINFTLLNVENTGKMTVNGGTTWFQADVGSISGDQLIVAHTIEGTSGKIAVENLGFSSTDGTEKLILIKAKNGGAGFTLTNAVEQGGYIYLLDNEFDGGTGTNWFLYGTERSTSSASASVNVVSGGYLLNYAETQALLQRMGDLRQDQSDGGIWARAFGGKFTSSSDGFLSGFDMSYSGMQVGADKKIALKNKGSLYLGGMFGYSKGNLDYGVGSGSIDSKTLGAYGTYIAPTGFYADLVLKYGWMKNDFKVLDTAGDWVTGEKMKTDGLAASLEIGQRIHLDRKSKEGWYLEPQAQLSTGHQSGGSFNASNGLQVDVDSYKSTLGRLGLNAGYEIKSGENPVNIYAKASYVHEFDGDVGYRLNGSREQTSFGDSWWTYGVGITAQLNQKHNIYLDIERASGGQFNQPWSVNGGYRFNW